MQKLGTPTAGPVWCGSWEKCDRYGCRRTPHHAKLSDHSGCFETLPCLLEVFGLLLRTLQPSSWGRAPVSCHIMSLLPFLLSLKLSWTSWVCNIFPAKRFCDILGGGIFKWHNESYWEDYCHREIQPKCALMKHLATALCSYLLGGFCLDEGLYHFSRTHDLVSTS